MAIPIAYNLRNLVVRRTTTVMTALGIGLTYAIHGYLDKKFPTLFFEITQEWLIKASVIAFLGAVLGAAYPALMAARKDPIDALSYE